MTWLLVFLPFVEIYVLIQVGEAIGFWSTIGLLFLSAILGLVCVRATAQGLLQRLNVSLSQGRAPEKELVSGLCVLIGGILLIIPGFVTDALAILLILPPTRMILIYFFRDYFSRQMASGHVHFQSHFSGFYSPHQQSQIPPERDVFEAEKELLEGDSRRKSDDSNSH